MGMSMSMGMGMLLLLQGDNCHRGGAVAAATKLSSIFHGIGHQCGLIVCAAILRAASLCAAS